MMRPLTEDNVFGPVHHHHASDGSVSVEHRHHTFFEVNRGLHEHFEPIEGARCTDATCEAVSL